MLRPYILCPHLGGPMRTRSLTIALALCVGCSGGKPAKSAAAGDSLTERQRDSILARSRIPGASGVSGQIQPPYSMAIPHTAHGTCTSATARQRHARNPPSTTNVTNAACTRTTPLASMR